MLFGHSDDFYNFREEVKVDFSSNVWKGVNLDKLNEHLISKLDRLSSYPEPDAGSLRRLLARRYEIKEEQVTVTNGSTTAFYLIAQAFAGSKSTILIPSFSEYEDACLMHGHEVTFYANHDDLENIPLKGQNLCWIGNPNSPDGHLIRRPELLRLIAANKHTTFVIDQAYSAFTTEEMLKPSDIKTNKNLILVNSISKAYNVPGLRVGYIMATAAVSRDINKYIIPWSINAPAIEASKYILIHPAQFTLPIRKWQRETAEFIYLLSKIEGVEILPTAVTFFLVRLKKGTAAALKEYMMKEHGLLIRDASNIRGLDASCFRVCTRTTTENRLFVDALQTWMSTF